MQCGHQPIPGRLQHLRGRHDWVVAAAPSNADRAAGTPGQPIGMRRDSSTVLTKGAPAWEKPGSLSMLLNPFCPFSTAKVLALKATVLMLLTLLLKARVQIAAGSALGILFLMLQTLVFLAISGGIVLAAGGAAVYAMQQRRTA
jgi:hypothetical protein